MDLSSGIGSLPVVGLLVRTLPVSEFFVVTMDTSSVVAVN
jgi:hypothetical protein